VDKKFYRPTTIQSFAIVVFERAQRFNENDANEMGRSLLDACGQVGIIIQDTNPSVFFANAQNGVIRVSTYSSSFLSLHAHHWVGTYEDRQ
jgi:eukaryotic translation initiation factor 2C